MVKEIKIRNIEESREKKKKTLDKQGTMTTEGGKHTRKNSDNGRVQKKDTFRFQKIDH